jgi:hypothetical protein
MIASQKRRSGLLEIVGDCLYDAEKGGAYKELEATGAVHVYG